MKSKLSILLIIPLTLFSCKKDNLKDEKSLLIGDWAWSRTEKTTSMCDPPVFYEIIEPGSVGKVYSMRFEKKGIVSFFEDDNLKDEKRIVFKEFYHLGDGYAFSIMLNNDENDRLLGIVYDNGDSLFTWDYPYKATSELCEEYKSHFTLK